jgi:hypothetical protein
MSNDPAPAPADPNPAAPNMEALVITMAKAITSHPEDVAVESFEDDGIMVAELTVHPEDLGKVIGRQGRTVRCMRMILEAASERQELPWELDIVEDEDEEEAGDDSEAASS